MSTSIMSTGAVWKMQGFLHSADSKMMPALLMLIAGGMLVYRHVMISDFEMEMNEGGNDSLKTFLALIILQMLPLIFLEVKILSCPDPVTLLGRFGPKVILMHACFLTLRICIQPWAEVGCSSWNYVGLAAACIVLRAGFNVRCSLSGLFAHCDVLFLVVLAGATALFVSSFDVLFSVSDRASLQMLCSTFSDYIEILAFVPAVWAVHNQGKSISFDGTQLCTTDPRTQALFFFGFLVSFYFMEDVCNAYGLGMDLPLAAAGHMIHFLLLLDFAGFLLAHFYNPENLKGSLLRWLPDVTVLV